MGTPSGTTQFDAERHPDARLDVQQIIQSMLHEVMHGLHGIEAAVAAMRDDEQAQGVYREHLATEFGKAMNVLERAGEVTVEKQPATEEVTPATEQISAQQSPVVSLEANDSDMAAVARERLAQLQQLLPDAA